MYIRKSLLGAAVAFTGGAVLLALMILFCFMETGVPAYIYAAAWFFCLYAMLKGVSVIYG